MSSLNKASQKPDVPRQTTRKNGKSSFFVAIMFLCFIGVLVLAILTLLKPDLFVSKSKNAKSLGQGVPADKSLDQVDNGEAVTISDTFMNDDRSMGVEDGDSSRKVGVSSEEDPHGKDKVVKIRSDVDDRFYFVAASLPEKKKAANKMAEIHRRAQYLLQSLDETLDQRGSIKAADGKDITENMRRLVSKHYKKKVAFAEYHNPNDKTVGSNSDKGVLIEICLRSKKNPKEWNSDNSLFRVHVHELAHSADKEYREDGDHGPDFRRLQDHLLQVAENLGIYNCAEFKRSNRAFCGLYLTENDSKCG